jgi:hypothetical protein
MDAPTINEAKKYKEGDTKNNWFTLDERNLDGDKGGCNKHDSGHRKPKMVVVKTCAHHCPL